METHGMAKKLVTDGRRMAETEAAESVYGSRISPGRMRVFLRLPTAIGGDSRRGERWEKGDGLGCWVAAMLKGRRARQRVCARHEEMMEAGGGIVVMMEWWDVDGGEGHALGGKGALLRCSWPGLWRGEGGGRRRR